MRVRQRRGWRIRFRRRADSSLPDGGDLAASDRDLASNWPIRPSSCRRDGSQPLDVEGQAHEVPLSGDLLQSPHAEAPESEHFLDPAVRRLRQPLALRIPRPAFRRAQLLDHSARRRMTLRVPRRRLPVPSRRHVRVHAPRLQLRQVRFVAVPRPASADAGRAPCAPPPRRAASAAPPGRSRSTSPPSPPPAGARPPPPPARCSTAGSPPRSSS